MPVQQAGEFAETGEYDIIFIDIPGSMDVRSRSLADYLQCGLCCVTTMICQWQSLFWVNCYIIALFFWYTLMLLFTNVFTKLLFI